MKIDIAQTKFQPNVLVKLVELIRKDDRDNEEYACFIGAIDAGDVVRLARFLDKPGKYHALNDPSGKTEVVVVRDGPEFSKHVREATRSPSFQDDDLIQQMEADLTMAALEDEVVMRSMRDSDMSYETLRRFFGDMVPERIERWAAKASIDLEVLDRNAREYLQSRLAKSLAEYMI